MEHTIEQYRKWRKAPEWMERVHIDELERLAAIGFTPEQLALYFRVNRQEFLFYFNLQDSPLAYHYERGRLVQQAREGINMQDAAVSGDNATQAQRFDKLREAVSYKNTIDHIFFEDVPV